MLKQMVSTSVPYVFIVYLLNKFEQFQGCNFTANHSFLYSEDIIDMERMSRVNLTFSEVPFAEDIVNER